MQNWNEVPGRNAKNNRSLTCDTNPCNADLEFQMIPQHIAHPSRGTLFARLCDSRLDVLYTLLYIFPDVVEQIFAEHLAKKHMVSRREISIICSTTNYVVEIFNILNSKSNLVSIYPIQ